MMQEISGYLLPQALEFLRKARALKIEKDDGTVMRVLINFKSPMDIIRGRLLLSGSMARKLRGEKNAKENKQGDRGAAAPSEGERLDIQGDGAHNFGPAQAEPAPKQHPQLVLPAEDDAPAQNDSSAPSDAHSTAGTTGNTSNDRE
ncbi:hypothetical protein COU37_01740 [Candidatus Micrarchaeota archaeon CG10_big_fil_rev_8_21_14_0_10_45_29]|nr:MAG: hypothetical protein COU37_01740 [Candidatus Micrarchaeota archaeon CG10_big_fil_rev_8_21_14_0_10_45_29]